MAQIKQEKNKLQLDDPSIILSVEEQHFNQSSCVKDVKSKNQSAASTSVNKKETRPKSMPVAKHQKEKKSDPVNINPDKRWQFKSSCYQNKGYNAENYSYKKNEYSKGSPYRSSSSHLPHSTTSPLKPSFGNTKKMSSSNLSFEKVPAVKPTTSTAVVANPIRKTGTPIDNLMHGKLAPSFTNSKSNNFTPKPLQQLLGKTAVRKEPLKPPRSAQDKKTSDPTIVSDNKNRIKSAANYKSSEFGKDPSVQNYESSREKEAKVKKKPNNKAKRNKFHQPPPDKVAGVKVADDKQTSQARKNIEAGKTILQMVNGGPKTAGPKPSDSGSKLSESGSQTDQKQDKASSTLSPVEKKNSKVLSATVKNENAEKEKIRKSSIKENSNALIKSAKEAEKAAKAPGIHLARSLKSAENGNSKKIPAVDKQEAERMDRLAHEQAAQRFKKEYVIMLKKAPSQHPGAKFFCKLCIYHMDTIQVVHRHIKEKRHKKNVKEHVQNEFLRNLKLPGEDALDEINTVLFNKVLKGKILDSDDVELRMCVVQSLDDLIRKELPDCRAVLYGSSLSGLGFKTSDVNIDLQYPDKLRAPTVLLEVLNIIKKSGMYVNVQAEFHVKLPRIDFVDEKTKLHLQLSTGNDLAVQTSRLLRFYALLDERVVQLSMIHRTWARMCRLDLQHDGALPPHSLPIMAIFYMQKKNFTPVLHECISEWDMDRIVTSNLKCPQLQQKGSDWWYHPTPPPDGRKKSDPTEATEESDSDNDLDVTFELQETSIDFNHLSSPDFETLVIKKPGETSEEHYDSDIFSKPILLCSTCVGGGQSLAGLWLDMLRFYALQYPIETEIISIRSSETLMREDKKWHKKRIGMLDPYSMKRNLCRSLNTQGVFTYFVNRLKAAVLYYFKPSLRRNSNSLKSPEKRKSKAEKGGAKQPDNQNNLNQFADNLSSTVIQSALPYLGPKLGAEVQPAELSEGLVQLAEHIVDQVMADVAVVYYRDDDATQDDNETSQVDLTDGIQPAELSESLVVSDGASQSTTQGETRNPISPTKKPKYSYDFSTFIITGNKYPVKVCGLCKREGHARTECPEDSKPIELDPLPPFSPELKGMLDRVCHCMYDMYVLTPMETKHRDNICDTLTVYLQRNYNAATRMNLFGSSRNGFGFRGSDLDICMTFEGNQTGEDLDSVQVIEEVAKQLRKNKDYRNILPITTAKVPIVKFYHHESRLEGDISLYNLLAQRNTSMLKCYSLIDDRCKVLGYVMKAFVKRCNIGDASRGSLSSYAYTLMVIYYLQQKEVPVLPVLQEVGTEKEKPLEIVDGWDSWFYNDLETLPQVWEGFDKNKESIGELWLGLLRFYTEEFNFRQQVVSIRQKKTITTFEKEWTSKFISIEDPFDLNHNLAAGVSHKMATFITNVFVKAREHFGTLPKIELRQIDECEHFFDDNVLMNGQEAPNDRCCRICGKIGHYLRDCPRNKRNKRQDGKDGSNAPERSLIKCFYCGNEGHIKRECPEIKLLEEQEDDDVTDETPATPKRTQPNVSSARAQPNELVTPSLSLGSKTPDRPKSSTSSDQHEDVGFPRSLPANFMLFNESANQSKRLYQRVSESETSSRRDEKTQVPKPSYGPLKVPLTPPASFKLNPTFPSTSTLPRPPIFPSSFFSTSPAKANSVPPRNTAQPTSSSVLPPSWPTTSVPPPSVHGGPTWPNSPIWGFSLHPPPSQSVGKPVMPSFESKLQESNPARTTSPAQRFSVTSLTHGLPMTSPPPALPVMSPPGSLTSPPHGMAQDAPRLDPANNILGGIPPPPLPSLSLVPGFRLPNSSLFPVSPPQPSFPSPDHAKAPTSSEALMTSPMHQQVHNFNIGQLHQKDES